MTTAAAHSLDPSLKSHLHRLMLQSCDELRDATTDFFAKYQAIHHLRSVAQSGPGMIYDTMIHLIQAIFKNKRFAEQRQSLFFSARRRRSLQP